MIRRILLLALAVTAAAQDKVEIDNPWVHVVRVNLSPRAKIDMLYMTELHTTMKLGDGRVVDNSRQPGDIAWRDALKYQTEQMGDKTVMEIQVEIK